MKRKWPLFTALFKKSGIKFLSKTKEERLKITKIILIFVMGQFAFWFLFSDAPAGNTPLHSTIPNHYLKNSLMISLRLRILGTLETSGATRMSLKHESKNLLIPEVFIHGVQWENPHWGVAKVELLPRDLKSILKAGLEEYSPFLAFPWNPQLLQKSPQATLPQKEAYEIHLD